MGTYVGRPPQFGLISGKGDVDLSDIPTPDFSDAIAELVPPVINPEFVNVDEAPNLEPIPTTPDLSAFTYTVPAMPEPFTGSLDLGAYLPEAFDQNPPELQLSPTPTPDYGIAPAAPGVSLVYEDPELELSLPAPPSLLSLNITPFAGVNIPSIDFTVPELTVAEPSIREYIPAPQYASSLLRAVSETLQDRIENGGTGLRPEVEQAIWDRGREREARTMRDQLDDLDRYETLGYALPPGVWMDARLKVATENAYANMGVSREIMIKMAELEQANVLKALDGAVALEGKLIDYANLTEQRAFEATRYATEAGIAIYNAKVQAYSAYVDAYKAKVTIYDAQVRAELAKVEAYRAQIAAEQAKTEINNALVNQFKVLTDAALSNVDVYKARIEAIRSKAEIEQIKVAIFGEQVRAYAARINAFTAQVEGFKAAVGAEATKQDAYKSQVQAFVAQVEAGAKQIDAKINEYRARVDAKNQEWQAFSAAASAEAARAQALASSNSSLAEMYRAEVTGYSSYNETMVKAWEASTRIAIAQTEVATGVAKVNAENYISTRSLMLDAAKVQAQVKAQLGAAAYGTYNFSESVSNSSSRNMSSSWSESLSESYSFSTEA